MIATPETIEEVETGKVSNVELAPPYKVIFLNDDVTTTEFVVKVLVAIFQKDRATAMKLMLEVHETGAAVIAVLPFEEAEHRQHQVHVAARAERFPLRCLIESA